MANSYLGAATKAVESAKENYEKECRTALESILGGVFENVPELNRVVVRGWTPGFNDGDPCTHGQDVLVTLSDHEDHGESIEETLNELEVEFTTEVEKIPCTWNEKGYYEKTKYVFDVKDPAAAPLNPKLSEEDARAVVGLFDSLTDTFEQINDTNWMLTITRDGVSAKIEKTDYYEEY